MRRREFIFALGSATAALAAPLRAEAQDYPNRAVTLVVNFPPGGSTDAMARILREPLSQALGQNIVIETAAVLAGRPGPPRSPMPGPTATRFSSRSTRR